MTDEVQAREPEIETRGLAALEEHLDRLSSRKILVLSGPSRRFVDRVKAAAGDREVDVFDGSQQHVPLEVVRRATDVLTQSKADTVVSIGGGAATGLGKVLRLERKVNFVAIPTTYSGSEMTSVVGTTDSGIKSTRREPMARPDVVIYDGSLTEDMPRRLTCTSLLNALAHPISALSVGTLQGKAREEAFRAAKLVYASAHTLVSLPHHGKARAGALRAAALAAECIERGELGVHHRWVHLLGGRFDVVHSEAHAVVLPHFLRLLRDENPSLTAELADELGEPNLEKALFELLVRAGAPTSLAELGVRHGELRTVAQEQADVPVEVLARAVDGRCPSAEIRWEAWGPGLEVAHWGPPLEGARRVIVAVHGRGINAEQIVRRALEVTGNDPQIAIVAPQAVGNSWYPGRYDQSRVELDEELDVALARVTAVCDRVAKTVGDERLALFGFSQGACVALEVFIARGRRLASVVALSGARIGEAEEGPPASAELSGTPVLLGLSNGDLWIAGDHVSATARELDSVGCEVEDIRVSGGEHFLHGVQRIRGRELLTGRTRRTETGFGNVHQSEGLPGALPREQNTPRHAPYGLYPEQINDTGFTVERAKNRRAWVYRIRPSNQQSTFAPLEHPYLAADFLDVPPEVNLCGFAAEPIPTEPTDFVDGLVTLGGAGAAGLRRGYAIHTYAANRSMEHRALSSGDGELLILPQRGALTLLTELGVLEVGVGELAVVPRGLRFSVLLREGDARGFVAEVFGRHFELPERGPIGANGLSDARHFMAPTAWHEDRLAPGYRLTHKLGGRLYEAMQDYSPFDVVAWQGNFAPYTYDLALFSPVWNARVDHGDPSVFTVLSTPLDEPGTNLLDLVAFPVRWDATEHTFRPPYYHRNATTEFNGILREVGGGVPPFEAGITFLTPPTTPHGVVTETVERYLAQSDEQADAPRRSSNVSLWFQFESALPMSLTRWAREAPRWVPRWREVWGAPRTHFTSGFAFEGSDDGSPR